MTPQDATSEWTGLTGRIGAWYLASRLRRLSELFFLGNLHPRFLDVLALRGDEIVVDAGSGSGFYSLAIAEKLVDGQLVCIDASEEMLASLRRRVVRKRLTTRVEVRKGDVMALALPGEIADLAVSNGVWHELGDPLRATGELFRILKPGGRVAVTDFRDTRVGRRIGAAHRKEDHGPFSVEQLTGLLREIGFSKVQGEAVRHWAVAWGTKPPDA